MAKTVSLSTTGMTTPIDVWVCDSCDPAASCQYIDTTSSTTYSFTLPCVYEGYSTFGIKVIDSDDCQFCQTLSN
jgi:hypothetical protein